MSLVECQSDNHAASVSCLTPASRLTLCLSNSWRGADGLYLLKWVLTTGPALSLLLPGTSVDPLLWYHICIEQWHRMMSRVRVCACVQMFSIFCTVKVTNVFKVALTVCCTDQLTVRSIFTRQFTLMYIGKGGIVFKNVFSIYFYFILLC